MTSNETDNELRDWLKSSLLRYIAESGQRHRTVYEHFLYDRDSDRLHRGLWNTRSLQDRKWLFRSSLEQLESAGIIRREHGRVAADTGGRRVNVDNETWLYVNNVLDIMSRLR